MPNVTGMYFTDAEPLLRSLGWRGSVIKVPDVAGAERNRIVTQSPAPETPMAPDDYITLTFGR